MKQATNEMTSQTILTEVAWEVCNQVGGIYTVIRSKVPVMVNKWANNYLLLGPYFQQEAATDFEEDDLNSPVIQKAIEACRAKGLDIKSGYWLVSGRPQTILFNHKAAMHELGNIKYFYWQNHGIDFKNHDPLMDEVLSFGYMVYQFISELTRYALEEDLHTLAHFHEWMAASGPWHAASTTYR